MPETNIVDWTAARRALWARIEAHDFEPPQQPFTFTRRLAREQGWSLPFARGAILEYRRFCFLTMVSATPMTPSEEVDAVWHLHLVYSRDYWDVWCGRVLGQPLHHDPSDGTPVDKQRFRACYAETLALYERFFGVSPEAYWPATHLRFAPPSRWPRFLQHIIMRWR